MSRHVRNHIEILMDMEKKDSIGAARSALAPAIT